MSAHPYRPATRRGEQATFVLCLLLLGVSLTLSSIWGLGALALGQYVLLFGRSAGERRRLGWRLLALSAFLLLSLLPVALVRGSSEDFLLGYGGWGISLLSLALTIQVFLRCASALASSMLLLSFIPIYRLYGVLRSLGVPKLFIELVELTYRYIFMLEETAGQIRLAQTSRLGYQGSVGRRLEHFGMLLARTFILSQTEADRLYLGLVSRGYEEEPEAPVSTLTTPKAMPSISQSPQLALQRLSFSYTAGHTVLDQLSLTIRSGERIALLGHNGAGKSSLFLLLAGLQEGWEGQLLLHGEGIKPRDRARLRKHIALVLQNSNYQLFTPSVEEEISFGLKNLGLEGVALSDRLEEILTRYELQALRHKPPHQLSEGQKKWVALAAILATEPEVILLDEPTAALDQRSTRRVLRLLDELSQAGKTILLSTHDLELASHFADRVLLLEEGRLTADRPAGEFWGDRPLLDRAELDQPYAWRSLPARSVAPKVDPTSPKKYHLPLFLSADLLPVLFIGGGKGIWRKAQGLLERQLPFTVLADELCPELHEAHRAGSFTWLKGRYTGDENLSAYRILVCGVGDEAQERAWAERWRLGGFLYALLSDPDGGNIQFGATTCREGITLSVHSDYRLPEVAVLLRDRWAEELPPELGPELEALASLRRAYLTCSVPAERAELEQTYQQQKQRILQTFIR